MVRVTRLELRDFRNYERAEVALAPGLTVICGPNGAGKSNLLEALDFGCTGRSCRTSNELELVRFGEKVTRVSVDVEADGLGRYTQEHEAAVYFCTLEALQNVAKYAAATKVFVRLQPDADGLAFEVTDDGKGFDAEHTPLGSGLQNMADRLAALSGTLEVRSQPGHGTTVKGRLPLRAVAPAVSG